jgi:hypothetical protein
VVGSDGLLLQFEASASDNGVRRSLLPLRGVSAAAIRGGPVHAPRRNRSEGSEVLLSCPTRCRRANSFLRSPSAKVSRSDAMAETGDDSRTAVAAQNPASSRQSSPPGRDVPAAIEGRPHAASATVHLRCRFDRGVSARRAGPHGPMRASLEASITAFASGQTGTLAVSEIMTLGRASWPVVRQDPPICGQPRIGKRCDSRRGARRFDSESRQRVQSRAFFAKRQAAVTSSPVPNLDGVAGLTGVVVVMHVLRRNSTERSNLGHPRLRFGTQKHSVCLAST